MKKQKYRTKSVVKKSRQKGDKNYNQWGGMLGGTDGPVYGNIDSSAGQHLYEEVGPANRGWLAVPPANRGRLAVPAYDEVDDKITNLTTELHELKKQVELVGKDTNELKKQVKQVKNIQDSAASAAAPRLALVAADASNSSDDEVAF